MQDTIFRVFVVALGLITYPKQDPRVEEWDDVLLKQEHEEKLLREGEKLNQDMTPINQKMAHGDTEMDQVNQVNIHDESNESTVSKESDQHVAQNDVTLTNRKHSEDGSGDHKLSKEDLFMSKVDPSLPKEDNRELKTDHEDQTVPYVKLGENGPSDQKEDAKTSSSFRDKNILPGQQERPEVEEVFISQQEVPPSHLRTETSKEDNLEMINTNWEEDYLWYVWNTFSIISMIRFLRKYLQRGSNMKYGDDDTHEDGPFPVKTISAEVPLPDSDTLQRFHCKYIQSSPNKRWREDEFLEGFANDLLEAMRTISDKNGSMVIEDYQMMKDQCDIIVPLLPPEPYSFQCHLGTNQTCDMLPDMKLCGKIKMVENVKIQNGCPCNSSNVGDDVVCLLHCENENVKSEITDVYNGLLCMKDTPFLSKSLVTKWFQSTIRQAWALISHKYEFELNFRNNDAPGALVVRFRSGKMIRFNMHPVIKLNSEAYFFITAQSLNLDIFWTLNVSIYEDRLLHQLSRSLPANSCHIQVLEIAYFLQKRQTALTGRSALQDFHFKNTLMHLLLTKAPMQWHPENMACRLRDLLVFIEKSLQQKLLHHFLIGNPFIQKYIELPDALSQAKPVNLFHPLVAHGCLYTNALTHFNEMLRNTNMLIEDYMPSKCGLETVSLTKSSQGQYITPASVS